MIGPRFLFALAGSTATVVVLTGPSPASAARAGPDASGTREPAVVAGAVAGAAVGAVEAASSARAAAPVRPPPPPGRGAEASGSAHDRSRWRWPLRPRAPVLRPFRAPLSEYGVGHRGLDLAADVSSAVLAVEGGVVTHVGVVAGRGTITVRHSDGLSSTYEPVVPSPGVATGATVRVGQVLGTVAARAGPAHCAVRACLHLGARRGDAYLDPYPLLVHGRVRLLPLG